MIFYATKKAIERYKIKTIDKYDDSVKIIAQNIIDKETGDGIFEWGMKLFYFDKRKCIALMNYASKFTLFLVDVKMSELSYICNYLSGYLLDLYKDDEEMRNILLPKYLTESTVYIFDSIKDKSMITHLNHIVSNFAFDGYRFYDFIDNGILRTLEINKQVNFNFVVTDKIDGKKNYILPGIRFKELLMQRYKN